MHVDMPKLKKLAIFDVNEARVTKYIPVSHEMLRSNKKTAFTTIALFRHAYPEAKLFNGKFFFLGGSTELRKQPDGSLAGGLPRDRVAQRRLAGGQERIARGHRGSHRGCRRARGLVAAVRDLIYTMPPYLTTDADLVRISGAIHAAARAGRTAEPADLA